MESGSYDTCLMSKGSQLPSVFVATGVCSRSDFSRHKDQELLLESIFISCKSPQYHTRNDLEGYLCQLNPCQEKKATD